MPETAIAVETRKEFDEKLRKLTEANEQAGEESDMTLVTAFGDIPDEDKPGAIIELSREVDPLGARVQQNEGLRRARTSGEEWTRFHDDPASRMTHSMGAGPESLGQKFANVLEERGGYSGGSFNAKLEVDDIRATVSWSRRAEVQGRIEYDPQRMLTLLDLLNVIPTEEHSWDYTKETLFTNAAAEVQDGDAFAESALTYEFVVEAIETIGHHIPVHNNLVNDIPRLMSTVDGRMMYMTRQRLENQILNGNGANSNLRGILNVAGINTMAKLAAETVLDKVLESFVRIEETAFTRPDLVIMHPRDWHVMRINKGQDSYFQGPPTMPGIRQVDGVMLLVTTAIPVNTALAGDFAVYHELPMRRDVQVDITDSHADDFIKNMLRMRAYLRAGNAVIRPVAFCAVTGLNT